MDLHEENIHCPPAEFESVITMPSVDFQKILFAKPICLNNDWGFSSNIGCVQVSKNKNSWLWGSGARPRIPKS